MNFNTGWKIDPAKNRRAGLFNKRDRLLRVPAGLLLNEDSKKSWEENAPV
jgi:hypothetical protein